MINYETETEYYPDGGVWKIGKEWYSHGGPANRPMAKGYKEHSYGKSKYQREFKWANSVPSCMPRASTRLRLTKNLT